MFNQIMRWFMVPVSAVLIVGGLVAAARLIINLVDALCTPENMIGGSCVEPWHTGAVEIAIYSGLILCALGLTLIPPAIAPKFKHTVSIAGAVLLFGATGVAYYLTRWPELFAPMLVAGIASAIGVYWMHTRITRL